MSNNFQGLHYETGESVSLQVENGWIVAIEPGSPSVKNFIAPGLIDNQVNGFSGVGFTTPGLSLTGIRKVIKSLQEVGVTSFLTTLITASRELLIENLSVLGEACEDPAVGNSLVGIHLEGPFISPEDGFRGAHNLQWVKLPDLEGFTEMYKASQGRISHLTLAPELEGALDLIKFCCTKGITVGLAHHNANALQIEAAVEAGAGLAVHLGNGISNLLSRHHNPIWPQLANDSLMISMIADGFHLTPEEMITFFKVKGTDKIILTSDCTDLAGMPPGDYYWDGKEVRLEPEGVIRYPAQNVLAGAASPLIRDMGKMMQTVGCSLADVIHMACRNPARYHKLKDRGELEVGKRADLILVTVVNGEIHLEKTVKAGESVFE